MLHTACPEMIGPVLAIFERSSSFCQNLVCIGHYKTNLRDGRRFSLFKFRWRFFPSSFLLQNESFDTMQLCNLSIKLLIFHPVFNLSLSCSYLMKLFRSLMGRSFPFRSLKLLKTGLFIPDNSLLIIDLFLIFYKSFSSDPTLLILNLLDYEIIHKERCSLIQKCFDGCQHGIKIPKFCMKGVDIILLDFAKECLEVEESSMKNIFNIACGLSTLSFKFYDCLHFCLEIRKNIYFSIDKKHKKQWLGQNRKKDKKREDFG